MDKASHFLEFAEYTSRCSSYSSYSLSITSWTNTTPEQSKYGLKYLILEILKGIGALVNPIIEILNDYKSINAVLEMSSASIIT